MPLSYSHSIIIHFELSLLPFSNMAILLCNTAAKILSLPPLLLNLPIVPWIHYHLLFLLTTRRLFNKLSVFVEGKNCSCLLELKTNKHATTWHKCWTFGFLHRWRVRWTITQDCPFYARTSKPIYWYFMVSMHTTLLPRTCLFFLQSNHRNAQVSLLIAGKKQWELGSSHTKKTVKPKS